MNTTLEPGDLILGTLQLIDRRCPTLIAPGHMRPLIDMIVLVKDKHHIAEEL